MPRPFPVIPRGPRRRRRPVPETLLLACPRVAPDWELGALRALIKPQTRGAIAHRAALQPWTREAPGVLEAARRDALARLGLDLDLHFPSGGDYHFVAEVERAACEEAASRLGVPALRDATLAQVEAELDGVLRRRARHVVSEDERDRKIALTPEQAGCRSASRP